MNRVEDEHLRSNLRDKIRRLVREHLIDELIGWDHKISGIELCYPNLNESVAVRLWLQRNYGFGYKRYEPIDIMVKVREDYIRLKEPKTKWLEYSDSARKHHNELNAIETMRLAKEKVKRRRVVINRMRRKFKGRSHEISNRNRARADHVSSL